MSLSCAFYAVLMFIPCGTTIKNRYFIRVGTQSREPTPEELGRLFQQRGNSRAELRPVSSATLVDLDMRRLSKLLRAGARLPPPRIRRPRGRLGDAGPDPIQPLPALVISRMVEMRKEKLVATMLLSDTCIQRKGPETIEVMRIIHPNNPPCRCSEVRDAQR